MYIIKNNKTYELTIPGTFCKTCNPIKQVQDYNHMHEIEDNEQAQQFNSAPLHPPTGGIRIRRMTTE